MLTFQRLDSDLPGFACKVGVLVLPFVDAAKLAWNVKGTFYNFRVRIHKPLSKG